MNVEERAGVIANLFESPVSKQDEILRSWVAPENGIDLFVLSKISFSETEQRFEAVQRGKRPFDGYLHRNPYLSSNANIIETKIMLTTRPKESELFIQLDLENGDFICIQGSYSQLNKVFVGEIEHKDTNPVYPHTSSYGLIHSNQDIQVIPHQFTGLPSTTTNVVSGWYDTGLQMAQEIVVRSNKLLQE